MKKLAFILLALPFLFACKPNYSAYNIPVDLAPEERAELEVKVSELKEQIDSFESEKEGVFPDQVIVNLAKTYESMGDVNQAILFYEGFLNEGLKGKVVYNNLARLYERIEAYEKAIELYQRIYDDYYDEDYLYDITRAHIRLGDLEKAETSYDVWSEMVNRSDSQVEMELDALREAFNQ